ncbi:hypothetical protein ABZ832_22910 [Streptantibioticus parmotrematis]|uniref:terpene synthase family protein n=1 Tax=Streptantibioticus parmotrematis TaxID=2873249 RepID=UPI0033C09F6A
MGIPTLWCPFPARVNPRAAGIEEHLIDWARRFDLVRSPEAERHLKDCGFGKFAADVYPRAERLRLVAEWTVYSWILDDQLDEGHEDNRATDPSSQQALFIEELIAQLTPEPAATPEPAMTPRPLMTPEPATAVRPVAATGAAVPSGGPAVAAIADLWRRTAGPMSRAWRERFAAHYRDYLVFSVLPLPRQPGAYGTAPELTGFVRRRRLFSGCEMFFDLSEVANAAEVPAVVADSDPYRAIRLAANDIITWTNDIYSVRKELARGDHDHNIVAVLKDITGDSWQETLDRVAGMIAESTRDFLQACKDLRGMRFLYGLDDEAWGRVEDSLTDLGAWISGSLNWHRTSPRYQDGGFGPAGQAPVYVEQHLY